MKYSVMVVKEAVGWITVEAEDEGDARQKVLDMDDIIIDNEVYYWDLDGPITVTDAIDEVR